MDQDGSLAISFDEWRDFLLYAPSTDIIEIIKYWRHSTVSNYISVFFLALWKI
jgi:solute carrier family 25 phosphate transporter 23/24/25/41